MKRNHFISATALIIILGSVVGLKLTHAAFNASAAAQQAKESYVARQIQHIKQTGGKAYTAAESGPALLPPLTRPTFVIVPAQSVPLPNATVVAPFNLSSNVYTDRVHWSVWSGDTKANPQMGIVIIFDLAKNMSMRVISVPGAGMVTITGFEGTQVHLQSDLGKGTFNTETQSLTWG